MCPFPHCCKHRRRCVNFHIFAKQRGKYLNFCIFVKQRGRCVHFHIVANAGGDALISGNLIHKDMCSRTVNVNAEREHEQANFAQSGCYLPTRSALSVNALPPPTCRHNHPFHQCTPCVVRQYITETRLLPHSSGQRGVSIYIFNLLALYIEPNTIVFSNGCNSSRGSTTSSHSNLPQ
jgi:hypothetical protein